MPGVQCNGREGTQRNTGAEKARQDWEGSHWKAARSPQEKHLEPTQKRKARAWMHLIFQNCSEKYSTLYLHKGKHSLWGSQIPTAQSTGVSLPAHLLEEARHCSAGS